MGKEGLLYSFLGIFVLSVPSYGFVYDVFLKEGKCIFNLHREGKNKVLEETRCGEKIPLFKTFRVEQRGRKILLIWQPSDPDVEKVLIITDGGLFEETSRKVVQLKTSKVVKEIKVYPISRDGRVGLPASVRLERENNF